MWVYQEQQNLPALSAGADAPEPVEPGLVPERSAPVAETLPAEPIIEEAEAKEKIPKRTLPHASRDCILLAGAYLFGTFLAGALSALCSAGELETLGYYLDCWRASFAANTAAEVVGLFRTEFLTTSGALVVLLLLGLSAIGSLPIFFFVMLYGTGAGMLSFQLLADLNWKALAAYCIASGVPTALAAGCLCLFGASVKTRISCCPVAEFLSVYLIVPNEVFAVIAQLVVGEIAYFCSFYFLQHVKIYLVSTAPFSVFRSYRVLYRIGRV